MKQKHTEILVKFFLGPVLFSFVSLFFFIHADHPFWTYLSTLPLLSGVFVGNVYFQPKLLSAWYGEKRKLEHLFDFANIFRVS